MLPHQFQQASAYKKAKTPQAIQAAPLKILRQAMESKKAPKKLEDPRQQFKHMHLVAVIKNQLKIN